MLGEFGEVEVARRLTGTRPLGIAVDVVVVLVATLVMPLLRRDRATPGQWAFALGLADAGGDAPAGARSVWRRFAVWWLPVLVLAGFDRYEWVPVLALAVGLAARLRSDRRSLLGLVGRTRTVTAASLRPAPPTPEGDSSAQARPVESG